MMRRLRMTTLIVLIACAVLATACASTSTRYASARIDEAHDAELLVEHDLAIDHDHDAPQAYGEHAHAHEHDDAHVHQHPAYDPHSKCVCASYETQDVWCMRCDVGYVAQQRIESAMLFEALDPHGHRLDVNVWECATCKANYTSNGFCAECGMGCHNQLVYFTRLTHGLARGRRVDLSRRDCATFAGHSGDAVWCDRCSIGIVGNVVFSDQDVFEVTAREFSILKQAIDRSAECELCACAMVAHRDCPTCLISYQ